MLVSKSQLSFAIHFVNKKLLVAKFGYPHANIGPIVDCTNFKLCVELFVHFISFHFYIFLEGYPSALLVFKGPSFKRKTIYIYIQLKYSDYNTTKKKKRKKYHKSYIYTLQEKVNGAKRAWLLASF